MWMNPFLEYLKKDNIPNDATQAKKLIREASKYILEMLFFSLLKCLDEDESGYVMRETHEGVCGSHIRGRALAVKSPKSAITGRH
ncbi:hypothetical protein CR513_18608, partial [Mucuna pruriens]